MKRITSIDIFRALTMLMMVFVDDLWTLHNVPHWLEHTAAQEDAMGLSDIVFPFFLFIVGLSIPFAIKSRFNKGDSKRQVLFHVLKRSFALIIMGLFFVNHEYYSMEVTFYMRKVRAIAMVVAFVLVWNQYEKNKVFGIVPVWLFQGIGVGILIVLAALYKGGTPENPQWMSPHWWGILGLIGWAYLFSSLAYLLAGNRIWILSLIVFLFFSLNVQEFRQIAGMYGLKFIISASNYALVMSGVLTTAVYNKFRDSPRHYLFPLILLIPATVSLVYGFSFRPLWGISKILATPSWTAISAGFSFLTFALVYTIADVFNHTKWAGWIMPAGTNTLTCYLIPGVIYMVFFQQIKQLPEFLSSGSLGIIKSLVFAIMIIFLTGGLEKLKIKVKL